VAKIKFFLEQNSFIIVKMEIRFLGNDFQASECLEKEKYHGDVGRLPLYQIFQMSKEVQKI